MSVPLVPLVASFEPTLAGDGALSPVLPVVVLEELVAGWEVEA